MEAPNKHIRPRDIAVVLLGDMTVFLAFVILGKDAWKNFDINSRKRMKFLS
jgi:hypothetical protein